MNTEQERAELLPCPFCGSTNIEIQTSTPDREGTPTHLMCADCGAAGPWSYERGGSYTVAAALWNTRAALQSQDREDAGRLDWLENVGSVDIVKTLDGKTEVFAPHNDLVYAAAGSLREAIDHARRIEGDK